MQGVQKIKCAHCGTMFMSETPLAHVQHVLNQAKVKEVMRELVIAAAVTAINFLYAW
jgi:hypothetical protein